MPLDFILIMLGTNDVKVRYGPPKIDEIKSNFEIILDYIHTTCENAKPLLLLPPPIGNQESVDFRGAARRISRLSDAISLLAKERDIHAIDIHSILDLKIDMESDFIHLNPLGREKIADSVFKYFMGNL